MTHQTAATVDSSSSLQQRNEKFCSKTFDAPKSTNRRDEDEVPMYVVCRLFDHLVDDRLSVGKLNSATQRQENERESCRFIHTARSALSGRPQRHIKSTFERKGNKMEPVSDAAMAFIDTEIRLKR